MTLAANEIGSEEAHENEVIRSGDLNSNVMDAKEEVEAQFEARDSVISDLQQAVVDLQEQEHEAPATAMEIFQHESLSLTSPEAWKTPGSASEQPEREMLNPEEKGVGEDTPKTLTGENHMFAQERSHVKALLPDILDLEVVSSANDQVWISSGCE